MTADDDVAVAIGSPVDLDGTGPLTRRISRCGDGRVLDAFDPLVDREAVDFIDL